ncbi:MAG TPA: 4-alpha-glucanotransferase [Gemmatimonadaceae bacterium]|nr:4-alpha-glucanotransferase [Gemmatimonadaceae bacterium]
MPRPTALRRLADQIGIVPDYVDQTGKETRATSDETRVALLDALGLDAATEQGARRELEALQERDADRIVAPASVLERVPGRRLHVRVTLPRGTTGRVTIAAELRDERGRRFRRYGRVTVPPARQGATPDWLELPLPRSLALGYHTLRVGIRSAGGEDEAAQSLIVVPPSCPTAEEVLGDRRLFGLTANLYTVRSRRNWGVGDLTDLRQLAEWAAAAGAGFVGVNPLHALLNREGAVSPYSPVTRLFRNPLYLDVEAVPELADSPEAQALVTAADFRRTLTQLRAADRVDYERVMALKLPVLRALHRTFRARHAGRDSAPARAYDSFLRTHGLLLDDFATWSALVEHLAALTGRAAEAYDWHAWPEPLRDPRGPAVAAFREEYAEAVDFHRWLQFELDTQLGGVASRARDGGMPLGIYQDLAIGSSPAGSDTWAFPQLFVDGVSVGAPPDEYSADGQNWGFPPLHPLRLADDGYRYWIALVRASLRHGGALRMDHVMGLFQQFWIPRGKSGRDGAYLRFPSRDLLGILALESTRHHALVVGEDLGTVPPDVPPALEKWGILSSKVLYFEQDEKGYLPAGRYERRALATANTHDMATLAGFWEGSDIALRREVELIDDDAARKAERTRERERKHLVRRLAADGALDDGRAPRDDAELVGAVHRFLAKTPSVLVGLSLDDLTAERSPVNLPGVGPDRYPSWTRRMARSIDELPHDPVVAQALPRGER